MVAAEVGVAEGAKFVGSVQELDSETSIRGAGIEADCKAELEGLDGEETSTTAGSSTDNGDCVDETEAPDNGDEDDVGE